MVEEQLNLRMAGGSEAPQRARASLRVLNGALGELRPDVALLVSELVTNAVIHAQTDHESTLEMWIAAAPHRVRVEVADRGLGFSAPRDFPRGGKGKLGLFLVDQISSRWGVDERRSTVWFEIDR